MADLTKTEMVLDVEGPNNPDDVMLSIVLDPATWRDMGQPDRVTVTIEPGDRLNP